MFCFLDAIPSGTVTGGGDLGLPAGTTGLKIAFDTYNNAGTGNTGCGNNPEIQIAYGPGYRECPDATTPAGYSIVRVNNSFPNDLNFIRSNNYNAVIIDYNAGNITVSVNGTQWLTAFYPITFTGYVGFSAGTGTNVDRQSIRNVTIYSDIPTSNAGPNVSYCSGSNVQIGTTPDSTYSYSWSPAVGLSAANVANPTVSLTNTGSTPLNFTYTVSTSITGSGTACAVQDQVVVTVNPIPTSNFTVSKTSVCPGEPITITYTGNMGPLAGYTWNFNGGTVLSGSGQGPYQVSWPTSGPVQVTLGVSQYGCFSTTTTKNITVNPKPTITVSGPQAICEGDTARYIGVSSVNNSVFGWVPGPLTGDTVFLSPDTTTTYTVSAVSPNGCISDDTTFTLVIKPIPTAQITGDTLICNGDSTLLVGASSLTSSHFLWLPGADTSTQVWAGPSVNTLYHLIVAKDGCVSDTATFLLQVDSVPNLTVPDSLQICIGEDISATVISTTPGAQFNWQPGDLTGATHVLSPTVTTEYTVYAYNETCTSEAKVFEVEVLQTCDCKLIIPNAFTPNGDQVNDEFTVQNPQGCTIATFEFVLYNRWGSVVWKSTDIQTAWDGKCLMGNCSDGTYFWVFSYSYLPGGAGAPKLVTEKGTLTLAK